MNLLDGLKHVNIVQEFFSPPATSGGPWHLRLGKVISAEFLPVAPGRLGEDGWQCGYRASVVQQSWW